MKALLIGMEPPCSLGYTYVDAPPYEAVVIGSLSLCQMLSFSYEEALAALAAGKNRSRNLMQFCCCQNKQQMLRRFFDNFQQRVEC